MIAPLTQASTGSTSPFGEPSRTVYPGYKKPADRGGQYGDRQGIVTQGVSEPAEISFERYVEHFGSVRIFYCGCKKKRYPDEPSRRADLAADHNFR
jgi:hypothetical protein